MWLGSSKREYGLWDCSAELCVSATTLCMHCQCQCWHVGRRNSPLRSDAITRCDLCVSTKGISSGHVNSSLLIRISWKKKISGTEIWIQTQIFRKSVPSKKRKKESHGTEGQGCRCLSSSPLHEDPLGRIKKTGRDRPLWHPEGHPGLSADRLSSELEPIAIHYILYSNYVGRAGFRLCGPHRPAVTKPNPAKYYQMI